MIDPYILEELAHIDAMYLGLTFPSQIDPPQWHGWEARISFAKQLNHGPWAQVVRRREDARRRLIFHLETMMLFFGGGDSRYGQDILYLRGEL